MLFIIELCIIMFVISTLASFLFVCIYESKDFEALAKDAQKLKKDFSKRKIRKMRDANNDWDKIISDTTKLK